MLIDVLSPSYPYTLYTTTRYNNLTLSSNSYSTNVAVSTMNSTNLILANTLKIYSFIVGLIIKGQTTTLQFSTTGSVIDASTIQVSIASTVNLVNVTYVRIDTVLVDQTQIQFSGFIVLDFQTADCPTHVTDIVFAYPSSFENMFTGMSYFTLS